jgi:hypothetical protein
VRASLRFYIFLEVKVLALLFDCRGVTQFDSRLGDGIVP